MTPGGGRKPESRSRHNPRRQQRKPKSEAGRVKKTDIMGRISEKHLNFALNFPPKQQEHTLAPSLKEKQKIQHT